MTDHEPAPTAPHLTGPAAGELAELLELGRQMAAVAERLAGADHLRSTVDDLDAVEARLVAVEASLREEVGRSRRTIAALEAVVDSLRAAAERAGAPGADPTAAAELTAAVERLSEEREALAGQLSGLADRLVERLAEISASAPADLEAVLERHLSRLRADLREALTPPDPDQLAREIARQLGAQLPPPSIGDPAQLARSIAEHLTGEMEGTWAERLAETLTAELGGAVSAVTTELVDLRTAVAGLADRDPAEALRPVTDRIEHLARLVESIPTTGDRATLARIAEQLDRLDAAVAGLADRDPTRVLEPLTRDIDGLRAAVTTLAGRDPAEALEPLTRRIEQLAQLVAGLQSADITGGLAAVGRIAEQLDELGAAVRSLSGGAGAEAVLDRLERLTRVVDSLDPAGLRETVSTVSARLEEVASGLARLDPTDPVERSTGEIVAVTHEVADRVLARLDALAAVVRETGPATPAHLDALAERLTGRIEEVSAAVSALDPGRLASEVSGQLETLRSAIQELDGELRQLRVTVGDLPTILDPDQVAVRLATELGALRETVDNLAVTGLADGVADIRTRLEELSRTAAEISGAVATTAAAVPDDLRERLGSLDRRLTSALDGLEAVRFAVAETPQLTAAATAELVGAALGAAGGTASALEELRAEVGRLAEAAAAAEPPDPEDLTGRLTAALAGPLAEITGAVTRLADNVEGLRATPGVPPEVLERLDTLRLAVGAATTDLRRELETAAAAVLARLESLTRGVDDLGSLPAAVGALRYATTVAADRLAAATERLGERTEAAVSELGRQVAARRDLEQAAERVMAEITTQIARRDAAAATRDEHTRSTLVAQINELARALDDRVRDVGRATADELRGHLEALERMVTDLTRTAAGLAPELTGRLESSLTRTIGALGERVEAASGTTLERLDALARTTAERTAALGEELAGRMDALTARLRTADDDTARRIRVAVEDLTTALEARTSQLAATVEGAVAELRSAVEAAADVSARDRADTEGRVLDALGRLAAATREIRELSAAAAEGVAGLAARADRLTGAIEDASEFTAAQLDRVALDLTAQLTRATEVVAEEGSATRSRLADELRAATADLRRDISGDRDVLADRLEAVIRGAVEGLSELSATERATLAARLEGAVREATAELARAGTAERAALADQITETLGALATRLSASASETERAVHRRSAEILDRLAALQREGLDPEGISTAVAERLSEALGSVRRVVTEGDELTADRLDRLNGALGGLLSALEAHRDHIDRSLSSFATEHAERVSGALDQLRRAVLGALTETSEAVQRSVADGAEVTASQLDHLYAAIGALQEAVGGASRQMTDGLAGHRHQVAEVVAELRLAVERRLAALGDAVATSALPQIAEALEGLHDRLVDDLDERITASLGRIEQSIDGTLARVQRSLADARTELGAVGAVTRELANQVLRQASLDAAVAAITSRLDDLGADAAAQTGRIEALGTAIRDLQSIQPALEHRLAPLAEGIRALAETLEHLRDNQVTPSVLSREIATVTQRLASATGELSTAVATTTGAAADRISAEIADLAGDFARFASQLDTAASTTAGNRRTLDQVLATLGRLGDQLSRISAAVEIEGPLAEATGRLLDAIDARHDELAGAVASIGPRLAAAADSLGELRSLRDLPTELSRRIDELARRLADTSLDPAAVAGAVDARLGRSLEALAEDLERIAVDVDRTRQLAGAIQSGIETSTERVLSRVDTDTDRVLAAVGSGNQFTRDGIQRVDAAIGELRRQLDLLGRIVDGIESLRSTLSRGDHLTMLDRLGSQLADLERTLQHAAGGIDAVGQRVEHAMGAGGIDLLSRAAGAMRELEQRMEDEFTEVRRHLATVARLLYDMLQLQAGDARPGALEEARATAERLVHTTDDGDPGTVDAEVIDDD